ncbi:type II secretion system protein GspL [Marinobacter caseinilyticus]|uniref:type II secretion system protein GspL n=1 Tax=Marinobacter caseinilyticus TaxID=2692195 RepID=UPI00140CD38C|nr:type II secretion system protein GspL [Marinobacter caseinilyticus]
MSYRLYTRPVPPFADLASDPETQLFNWVLIDASGDIQAQGVRDTREHIEQTLTQNALENVRLIGLIPGDEALFCFADIPAKQARFVRQALPFAVEEQLAQDIDTVHLALGNREEHGFRVAAVDHQRMGLWSELFRDWHHARLEALYADASLLPVSEHDWAICLDGDSAMLASRQGEWLKMQVGNLAMFAETLALPPTDEVIAEVRVAAFGTQDELDQQQALIAGLQCSGRLVVSQHALELMPLELLAHSHHHHLCTPINLCQGSYALSGDGKSALRPWRPAIAVACLWFLLQVGIEIGLGVYHQQEADDFNEQAMAIYQKAFPSDTRTHAGNVRRVLEGQLRLAQQEGPNADFLTLMKLAGQQYAQLPGKESVEFNTINYSRSRGQLVVDLKADNFAKLNALRSGLTSSGLNAEIGSVVNEASGARGRLTISGG